MIKIIILLASLMVVTPVFSDGKYNKCQIPIPEIMASYMHEINELDSSQKKMIVAKSDYCKINYSSAKEIKKLLYQYSDKLSLDVISTVLAALKCKKNLSKRHNNILTIIDYSLPSSKKRIWIFDLRERKLLFHTYVSHGITSGKLLTEFFSNKYGSKATSLGVYMTENPYYGRHGLSLRLQGLEKGFNHLANQRNIVLHSAWYVTEEFKNKYGRIGRSWGCPAVPVEFVKPIVNTIKERSLFIVYYPSKQWFLKSQFLSCRKISLKQFAEKLKLVPSLAVDDARGDIIFADKNKNNNREESEPIIVMRVDDYLMAINTNVPLSRMLRRQINSNEYIALNHNELRSLDKNQDNIIDYLDSPSLEKIELVVAVVRKSRGYYVTEFRSVNVGNIKEIQINTFSEGQNQSARDIAVLISDKSNLTLRLEMKFIRWLGL